MQGPIHRYTQMRDWFEIEPIAPGIYRITERWYREDYRCNVYLVKGRTRDIVIDAGLGLGNLRAFLEPWAKAPLLVLSHAHYDHIGSAFEFEERAIHPAEAELIAHPNRADTYADLLLATADFRQLPWDGYDADTWQPVPAPATRWLVEGDMVDLGDRAFAVMSTPGHSWGSICLWDEKSGLMICADTVYEGEIFDELPCSDKPTYARTMDRLRTMPVELALPGHGGVLTGEDFLLIAEQYVARYERAAA